MGEVPGGCVQEQENPSTLTAATIPRILPHQKGQMSGVVQDTPRRMPGARLAGAGRKGAGWQGRAQGCAVQNKNRAGSDVLFVVSGPIYLGCYSDVPRLCGDFWTDDEGVLGATVTRHIPETLCFFYDTTNVLKNQYRKSNDSL